MKTGNIGGGITNKVLGATGADMSAVMSQAPGSLELLPFKEYGEGTEYKQWLRIAENSVWVNKRLPLIDPFVDIYTTDEWYGLFEEQLVNPDGLKPKYRTEKIQFLDLLMKDVLPFQTLLKNKYHSNSYVFYGKSEEYKCYGSATWNGKILSRFSNLPQDGVNKVGGLQKQEGAEDYKCYVISDFDVDGDGTVPFLSGAAPKGKTGVKCIHYLKTDHQAAYNAKEARLFTVWSIVQIMKQVTC